MLAQKDFNQTIVKARHASDLPRSPSFQNAPPVLRRVCQNVIDRSARHENFVSKAPDVSRLQGEAVQKHKISMGRHDGQQPAKSVRVQQTDTGYLKKVCTSTEFHPSRFQLLCIKKLLDRIKPAAIAPDGASGTLLGNALS